MPALGGLGSRRQKLVRRPRHSSPSRTKILSRLGPNIKGNHTKYMIHNAGLHRTSNYHGSPTEELESSPLKATAVVSILKPEKFQESSHRSEAYYAVPTPTPGSAIYLTHNSGFGYPMLIIPANENATISLSTKSTTKAIVIPQTQAISVSFSPLPPLLSLASTTSDSQSATTALKGPASSAPPAPAVDAMDRSNQERGLQTHKLATPIIVLLAVGAGCLFFGVCIIVKAWTRPQRRPRIKPSLPILEKGYNDNDDFDCKDSPVFGGKERLTPRPDSDGPLWTWVQYSRPISKSSESHFPNLQDQDKAKDICYFEPKSEAAETCSNLRGRDISPNPILVPAPALQNFQSAISQATNRFSTASLYSARRRGNNVLSMCGTPQMTSFTADGHQILERARSKDLRRSKSHSIIVEKRRRESVYRSELPYEGAEVSSPLTYYHPISTPTTEETSTGTEGRARIQSSYYNTGTYPRLSTMPVTYSIATATKVNLSRAQAHAIDRDDTIPAIPHEQRERERALSFAAGFSSPSTEYVVSSPQPTLYPDDSLSVVTSKRSNRRSDAQNKRLSRIQRPAWPTPSLPQVSDATSGTLLNIDFGHSRMSLTGLTAPVTNGKDTISGNHQPYPRTTVNCNSGGVHQAGKVPKGRCNDRPPRVPSPPPLPSLTQMGLANTNPEAYANYRSPTYSIYGLYGNDRESGY